MAGSLAFAGAAESEPVALSPLFVTANRTAEAAELMPFSNETFTSEAVRGSPNVTVDGLLREMPGFSLFRRSDSLVANPSTQGVSLRGLGPSGASRSLILLDGVPLIDPFGGWVLWSKVPRESLARIEIVPGAGGTAWGNAALGGVIQLFTEPAVGSRQRFAARAGSYQTLDLEAQFTEPVGAGTLQLLGRMLSTDGYETVAEEQRGPIDVPASSRARWATMRWRQPVGDGVTATLTVRRFAESRGNGTPYTRNTSDETFASLALAGQPSTRFQWNATAYGQQQDFTSTFSAVNATRTAETPASHQFAVPADTVGLAWVGEWAHDSAARWNDRGDELGGANRGRGTGVPPVGLAQAGMSRGTGVPPVGFAGTNSPDHGAAAAGASEVGARGGRASDEARTVFGFDFRDVRGETREDSAYVDGAFTRRRFAGGRQSMAGAFVLHRRALAPDVRASLGLRADGWLETDGHRRDFLRGEPAGDVAFGRRDGLELSPSAGVAWTPKSNLMGYSFMPPHLGESNPLGYSLAGRGTRAVRLHASVQQAFRRPTLNELYRAFRVGNVITDGNPALRTENVTSGEIGATVTAGRALPTAPRSTDRRDQEIPPVNRGRLTLGVTGFWNELRDSVANVTIASGPVTLPGIGFVPAGGEARRKHNLDRTRVRGVTLEAAWTFTDALRFEAEYLFNDARVTRAGVAPWLIGRRLAQVPEQSATAGVSWRRGRWTLSPRVRWMGQQFEDDNNRLPLAAATVIDVAVSATLSRSAEVFASAENLFDHRVETGRAASGLVSVGTPRLLLVGFRVWR
ncbi:TonB-dependent receptor plug [Opitutus terrae PB90-1]|uniref:TonB-dependent receptor plug n=2 Tax=Opitutus terrae TaxID=107709 RepID=B1ZVG3_OPITP|nr:TonB-dependent receptor plug [Opitutus terrae PB90-1]